MSIYKGTTLIAGALPNAANQDLSNLSQTGQAVIDGKADTDLSNATDNGKILMSSMGMPSETYIGLTLGASGAEYTAPSNGYFYLSKLSTGTNQYLSLQLVSEGVNSIVTTDYYDNNMMARKYLPVSKGNKCRIGYTLGGRIEDFRFYYAVGSESEAS